MKDDELMRTVVRLSKRIKAQSTPVAALVATAPPPVPLVVSLVKEWSNVSDITEGLTDGTTNKTPSNKTTKETSNKGERDAAVLPGVLPGQKKI